MATDKPDILSVYDILDKLLKDAHAPVLPADREKLAEKAYREIMDEVDRYYGPLANMVR